MTAPVVTIGGREVQVIGGAPPRAIPVPLDLSPDDDSAPMNRSAVTVVVVLALVASLVILLSAICARNRARPA